MKIKLSIQEASDVLKKYFNAEDIEFIINDGELEAIEMDVKPYQSTYPSGNKMFIDRGLKVYDEGYVHSIRDGKVIIVFEQEDVFKPFDSLKHHLVTPSESVYHKKKKFMKIINNSSK